MSMLMLKFQITFTLNYSVTSEIVTKRLSLKLQYYCNNCPTKYTETRKKANKILGRLRSEFNWAINDN